LDKRTVERALEAAADSPPEDRIRNAVEAVIDAAEIDPEGTREALWWLRGDRATLERLEACLGMEARQATLALGAAIQLAAAELAFPCPDLRNRLPELLRWLEGAW
jgi:hypothetical protein